MPPSKPSEFKTIFEDLRLIEIENTVELTNRSNLEAFHSY